MKVAISSSTTRASAPDSAGATIEDSRDLVCVRVCRRLVSGLSRVYDRECFWKTPWDTCSRVRSKIPEIASQFEVYYLETSTMSCESEAKRESRPVASRRPGVGDGAFYFAQCSGIPQGSVVSTLLCDLYLGAFERSEPALRAACANATACISGPTAADGGSSCDVVWACRVVDDTLALAFAARPLRAIEQAYGSSNARARCVRLNVAKTRATWRDGRTSEDAVDQGEEESEGGDTVLVDLHDDDDDVDEKSHAPSPTSGHAHVDDDDERDDVDNHRESPPSPASTVLVVDDEHEDVENTNECPPSPASTVLVVDDEHEDVENTNECPPSPASTVLVAPRSDDEDDLGQCAAGALGASPLEEERPSSSIGARVRFFGLEVDVATLRVVREILVCVPGYLEGFGEQGTLSYYIEG